MSLAVGVDVAKEIHWAEIKVAETGKVLACRRVENTPQDIGRLISDIREAGAVHGAAVVGLDILGGIAGLLTVMLLEAGLAVVHVPGLAVNRARQGTAAGSTRATRRTPGSSPTRSGCATTCGRSRRCGERTPSCGCWPGGAARWSPIRPAGPPGCGTCWSRSTRAWSGSRTSTTKTGLRLLTRYVTPAEIRAAGRRRVLAHLRKRRRVRAAQLTRWPSRDRGGRGPAGRVPGEAVAADLVRDLAAEA